MGEPIPLLENNSKFTPYYFYTRFIERVAHHYKVPKKEDPVSFALSLRTDFDHFFKSSYMDPIALPLLVSLGEQLKRYHNNTPLHLQLINTPGSNELLDFLYQSDFFFLVGKENRSSDISGRNIFNYDNRYIGAFSGRKQRELHKLRGYSLTDENLHSRINKILDPEDKRDYLIDHYTYKVQDHFGEILFESEISRESSNEYIMILSELITNGVLHSESNVYALMYSNRFTTKFSISDNGVGFYQSLNQKEDSDFYVKFELFTELDAFIDLDMSSGIKKSLLSIFEALYYSMLKKRYGLFDLVCKVVLEDNGHFRIHNNNAQIIVSNRMYNELVLLYEIRNHLHQLNNDQIYHKIDKDRYDHDRNILVKKAKQAFKDFVRQTINKYSQEVRFSSIRLFPVTFRGVHIEVEIPNSKNDWQ